ncbi:MAG: hypothetical protein WCF37_22995 [Pseudolabrys sp.]
MTGQYSIRNGLSLIAIEGSPNTLPASAFTMGELFKSVGYAKTVDEYLATLKKYPNPPPPNVTQFRGGG